MPGCRGRTTWRWPESGGTEIDDMSNNTNAFDVNLNSLNAGTLDSSNWKEWLEALTVLQDQLVHGLPIAFVIDSLSKLSGACPALAVGRLSEIRNSYDYMCDYMLKGYKDERRDEVYRQLALQLFGLISDMMLALRKKYDTAVKQMLTESEQGMLNADEMREALETYVSDYAMAGLEPAETREQKRYQLNGQRHRRLSKFFLNIVGSGQWSRELSNEMQRLLLSPTVDTLDTQVLISAIMMSTLLTPDAAKVMALIRIFSGTVDDKVRQRAFVGWVFALDAFDYGLYKDISHEVGKLLDDTDVCNELMELQMQVVYCMNAEKDNETIRRDVMPTLLRNQNLEMTRFGIKEKIDDPMEDILHGDEADKKMEEMEKGFKKMIDMQKQGADIYFGGFAKMKRFAFFYTLCNWFMPFYAEHPQLQQLAPDFLKSEFLHDVLDRGPFCDSDKYSFALGLSSVFDHLPSNIQELLNNGGGAVMPTGIDERQMLTPVFVRRQYLQDLYRFFRLNDYRKAFRNPFARQPAHVFFDNALYSPKLHTESVRVERFLFKQGMTAEASLVLNTFYDAASVDDKLMRARLAVRESHYDEAERLYADILKVDGNHAQALRGLALSSFYCGHYGQAAKQYQRLSEAHPGNSQYKQNMAISLISAKKVNEGVNLLYELYYNDPASIDVKRALAWGLLCLKRLEQARKFYHEILEGGEPNATDNLNAGYCAWFSGNLQEAVRLFRQVNGFATKLKNDEWLIDSYGISNAEKRIMEGLAAHSPS